jgi:D-alanyl-D-alanine dipeptidase
MKEISFICLVLICISCTGKEQKEVRSKNIDLMVKSLEVEPASKISSADNLIPSFELLNADAIIAGYDTLPDSTFVILNQLGNTFAIDMKYASKDNFLNEQVYDCPTCLIRVSVAKALLKANKKLKEKGYKIKFFDCYRPLDVQKKMWAIKPNTHFVANPVKGSMHNRGAAVDVTLVDSSGTELNMGTPFDYFGEEAHHNYIYFPKEVLDNRLLLKNAMEKAGFRPQNSEWWHYSLKGSLKFSVSNMPIDCHG